MTIGYMLYRTGDAVNVLEQIDLVSGYRLDELAFHAHQGSPGRWGGIDPLNATPEQMIELRRRLSGYRIDLHAPITTCNGLDSADAETRQAAVEVIVMTLDFAASVGAETVTIHPGSWCVTAKSGIPTSEQVSILSESLVELDEQARRCGVTIGMESTSHFDLPERLGLRNVGLTIDVGHMMFGWDEPSEGLEETIRVIKKHGERVVHMHIHDFRPEKVGDEDHWPVGSGVIDFRRILEALRDAGYNGSLCLELGMVKDGRSLPIELIEESADSLRVLLASLRKES